MSKEKISIPEVALATIAKEDSALQLACSGELSLAEIDQEYLQFADAAADFDDIGANVPYIKADGKFGRFTEPGMESQEEKLAAPKVLEGIVLARKVTPHLRGPKNSLNKQYPVQCRNAGMNNLLDTDNWICRSSNKSDSSKAQLNSMLTPEQATEARRLNIGGATGRGCDGCPFAKGNWNATNEADRHGALCNFSESLIWLDSNLQEPKVLSVGSYGSLKALKEFFRSKFKRGSVTIPSFAYVVRLAWTEAKENGNTWFVLSPSIVGAVEKAMLKPLDQVRSAQMWLLERVAKAQAENIVESHEREDGLEDIPFCSPEESKAIEDAIGGLM